MAKILLVEDDTNLSEIYQARMEAEGYTVVSAADGEAALAVAAKEHPDLIISDVMMPKISGFEMLDILRNTDGLKNTPVIMLTALGQADDKTRADSLGANRYLVKSQVTLEDIVNAAQALLNGEDDIPAAASSTVDSQEKPAAAEPVQVEVAAEPVAEAPATEPTTEPVVAPSDQPEPTVIQPTSNPETASEPVNEVPATEPTAEVQKHDSPSMAAPHETAATLDGAVIDDKVVASTVDKLLNKTSSTVSPVATPAPAPPETTTEAPTPTTAKPHVTGDRVVQPLNDAEAKPKRSLQELLAEEQAEEEKAEASGASAEQKPAAKPTKSENDPNNIAI